MANIVVPRAYPQLINTQRFVRNTLRPQAAFGRAIAAQLNSILARRRKLLFAKFIDPNNLGTGAAAATDVWSFWCETGYATSGALDIVAALIFAPSDAPTADDPFVTLQLRTGGVTDFTSDEAHYAVRGTSGIGASDLYYTQVRCRDVDAATGFEGAIVADNYARLVGCCVYEDHKPYFDETDTRANPEPRYFNGAPIFDAHEETLRSNADAMFRRNAAPIFSWCSDWGTSGISTFTSQTNKSILDTSTSTVTSTSKGFRPQLRYHDQRGSTSVGIKLAVKGVCASAGAGKVGISNSGGSLMEVTLPTSLGWSTATGNIASVGDTDTTKWDVMGRGDNGAAVEISVHAVSVLEYL